MRRDAAVASVDNADRKRNQFFGLPIAQLLAEFVTGVPGLCVFGIHSSFNSSLKVLRIRIHLCFLALAH
jgi:hypothetical protein